MNVLNVKALVGAFNLRQALSEIVKSSNLCEPSLEALVTMDTSKLCIIFGQFRHRLQALLNWPTYFPSFPLAAAPSYLHWWWLAHIFQSVGGWQIRNPIQRRAYGDAFGQRNPISQFLVLLSQDISAATVTLDTFVHSHARSAAGCGKLFIKSTKGSLMILMFISFINSSNKMCKIQLDF